MAFLSFRKFVLNIHQNIKKGIHVGVLVLKIRPKRASLNLKDNGNQIFINMNKNMY